MQQGAFHFVEHDLQKICEQTKIKKSKVQCTWIWSGPIQYSVL